MNIGIIGYGYWGPNLLRNFMNISDCNITAICDLRDERMASIKRNYPAIKVTNNPTHLNKDPQLDAIVIATSVLSHYSLAKEALLNQKHVLIEKPMVMSSTEAIELIELAEKNKKVLMVDHTFLYTSAVQKMKVLITSGDLGKILYFDSTRINLGLFQSDVNVLWDLAPHDISILTYLISEKPVSVNATGISHTNNGIENIAYMTINYSSGLIAHFNCSWSSPVKIRTTLVGGDKKMIVYNDLESTEKIKVYDTSYYVKTEEDKKNILVDYRVGDVYSPKLEIREALFNMTQDFLKAIKDKIKPISDYKLGLEVVKILEASQTSIKNKGKEVYL